MSAKKPSHKSAKAADSPADKASAPAHQPGAIKETIESIVIAFVLAFVFRAYVVEAFVIPTGSMAPTLLGEHLSVKCSQCGYAYTMDLPERGLPRGGAATPCPMCKHMEPFPPGARSSTGDRILVHKYLYSLSKPKRWDVVVFKNPQRPKYYGDEANGPLVNYIKRLVGLPGEEIRIVEGNIYFRPAMGDQPWQAARKTERINVQRAVWQPVYHSKYLPLDGGWKSGQPGPRWRLPWEIGEGEAHWSLPSGGEPGQMPPIRPDRSDYRFNDPGRGALKFNFHNVIATNLHDGMWHVYPYNLFRFYERGFDYEPIEDLRLSVTLRPDDEGLSVLLRTEARVDATGDSPDPRGQVLAARVTADGQVQLLRGPRPYRDYEQVEYEVIESKALAPIRTDRATTVELWFVDHEASVWVDGERVLARQFDIEMDHILSRPPLHPDQFPHVGVEVEGSPVTLHDVKLDRDLYYAAKQSSSHVFARAGIYKNPDDPGRLRSGDPLTLFKAGPGDERNSEYFCVGDNSPSSHDGRFWENVDPWIEHNMFAGEHRPGVVPEQLMMGRAFFVYFPAMHRYTPTGPGIFVNFGKLRFIH